MANKLLIRTPNHLGDCIMAMPMVNEAREAYPGAQISVLVPEHLAELYENNPGVDEILMIPTKYVHGFMAIMKIKDIISPHEFDLGYVLPPSFGAASGFKLGGVRERVGYVADGRRMLLTKPLPLPAPLNSEHRSIVYFNLLRRGSGADIECTKPKLFVSDNDIESGRELLASFGIEPETPYAVVAFRAVAESRRWGTERYMDLCEDLVDSFGLRVVLIGSANDQQTGDEIVTTLDDERVVNLAGKTSLREVAAICSTARVFVGNDSGPAHLAAAVGIPVVVLSGADDPTETSPMAVAKRLVYLEHLDCISCRKNSCPLKGDKHMRCMKDITVEMVTSRIRELLDVPAEGAEGTPPAAEGDSEA
ncbi:lipopolysaccharide heptosyltransferase II [candidate division GN15 bacterium]|nr:lipopolysaccharide heptosyltransferase II [candidate division GN15 bacterium]